MSIDLQKIQDDVMATRQMVETLLERLNQPTTSSAPTDDETPLTVQQAADFLNISRQTVYQNKDKIPHRKRHGRLYFFKTELAAYLNQAA